MIRRAIFNGFGHLFKGLFVALAASGVAMAVVSDWFYWKASRAKAARALHKAE